jgi:DNA-binding transcriptional LysR family regulator
LPDVTLELLTGIETIDLARGRAEIARRSRSPTQPDLTSVARIAVRLGVFAARRYVKKLTPPLRASDVDWITRSAPLEHLTPRPELEALVPGFRSAFASNDFVVQRRAVAEGVGGMILPAMRDADEPYAPLVELPLDLPPEGELFIVCAKAMRSVPRVAGCWIFCASASRRSRE